MAGVRREQADIELYDRTDMGRFPGDEPQASSGSPRGSGLHGSRNRWRSRPVSVPLIITMAAVVALGSGVAAWLTTGGGEARGTPLSDASVHRPPVLRATPSTKVAVPTTTTTTNPGSLPQTDALPTTNSPLFQSDMAALWEGVVSDSPTIALPASSPNGPMNSSRPSPIHRGTTRIAWSTTTRSTSPQHTICSDLALRRRCWSPLRSPKATDTGCRPESATIGSGTSKSPIPESSINNTA